MTDPIADMLTRIRNAQAVQHTGVTLPFSKAKFAIAEILKSEGYVKNIAKSEDAKGFPLMTITLKYLSPKEPAITSLKRISKPARRVYASKDELPVVLNNLGIAIISTSQGVMTNKQASKAGLGGEVVCAIY